MDKWIGKFVEKYNEMIFENISIDVNCSFHYINFDRLPKGFRRCVSDHIFYYETMMTSNYETMMTSKSLEDSVFDFIVVYRSTPYSFKVDFYRGFVSIFVVVENSKTKSFYKIPIGKYSISRFLNFFVSGQELEEVHLKENQSLDVDDYQFDIPF